MDGDAILPGCVLEAVRLADQLREAALEIPNPDSEADPDYDAARRAESGVDKAAKALQQHFECCNGDGFTFAREVLGDPPSFLLRGCNANSVVQCHESDPPSLRAVLRVMSMQALIVAGWVHERVRAVRNAVCPRIIVHPSELKCLVEMAGSSRVELLAQSHWECLLGLARGTAVEVRTNALRGGSRKALVGRIKELGRYIKTVPRGHRKQAKPEHAYYQLRSPMLGRLTVADSDAAFAESSQAAAGRNSLR